MFPSQTSIIRAGFRTHSPPRREKPSHALDAKAFMCFRHHSRTVRGKAAMQNTLRRHEAKFSSY